MSQLQKMIQRLCSNGVEFKKLGQICRTITTGKLNANAMVKNGKYPFFTCDAQPSQIDTYAYDTEAILISGNGSSIGHINYYKGKFNAYQRTYILANFNSTINIFFLFYHLKCKFKQYIMFKSKKGAVPYITLPILQNFEIPVPPLEVQNEIVRILDTFTSHAAELQAELQARKEQYEYYRNKLLSFDRNDENVKWMRLGEIGTFTRGNGLQKKDFVKTGIGCIHYGQIYTHYGTSTYTTKSFVTYELSKKLTKVQKGNLIIACTSENVEDVCKAVAWLGEEDIVTGGHSCVFAHHENPMYVSYFFQTEHFFQQKRKYAKGAKVIDIKKSDLEKIIIPIPSLSEQQRIVSILDKFETLVNDLTEGIPAEIAAIQEQYEYYRNKLLSFPKLEA